MAAGTHVNDEVEIGPEWTIDELAQLFGLTVRTTRYYVGLGLLPPATRRGRIAYYNETHRARLEYVLSLQAQGMTLSAIESHLAHLPIEMSVDEIELRRALATSWSIVPSETIGLADLEARARRSLTEDDLQFLERVGSVRRTGDLFETTPTLDVGIGLLDLEIPAASIDAATEAIRRHMDSLAVELHGILQKQVFEPARKAGVKDPQRFGRTMTQLKALTLEAVVSNFVIALNGLVDGSLLSRRPAKEVQ